MKKAFTMIELVFVIVILGILASVAIPKLAATRDDAKIVTIAQQVRMSVGEIQSLYVATGVIKKPHEMSQVLAQMVKQGKASETSNSLIIGSLGQITIFTQNGGNVNDHTFIIDINETIIQIKYGIPCNGIICKKLQGRIADGNFTIGGERVVF